MYLTLTGICNNIFGYFVRLFARQLLMLAITPLSIVFSVVKESQDTESFHTILNTVEMCLFPSTAAFPRSAISLRQPCRVVGFWFFFLTSRLIFPLSLQPFVFHEQIDFLFCDDFSVAFCSLTVLVFQSSLSPFPCTPLSLMASQLQKN